MVYHVIKTVKGNRYLYKQMSFREGVHVRTKSEYLGRAGDGKESMCLDHKSNKDLPDKYDKIRPALDNIIDSFRTGDIPEVVAMAMNPTFDMPCNHWSLSNRLIVRFSGTHDARGFKQWKEVGRYVKKGSKCIYILAPLIKQIKVKNKEGEEEKKPIVTGFKKVPIFRAEDTEGKALDYESLKVPETLPLLEVAEKWGISVKAIPANPFAYGSFNPKKAEIKLATPEESVFFHELAHSAHNRIAKLKGGQDWKQEIVAELSSAVLCRLVGRKTENMGQHFKYIENYAIEAGLDITKACLEVINETEKVLKLILEQAK